MKNDQHLLVKKQSIIQLMIVLFGLVIIVNSFGNGVNFTMLAFGFLILCIGICYRN